MPAIGVYHAAISSSFNCVSTHLLVRVRSGMEELKEANESQNKVPCPAFCMFLNRFYVSFTPLCARTQARRTMLCLAIALVFIIFCIVVFLLGKF
jgi:hypothetical protein